MNYLNLTRRIYRKCERVLCGSNKSDSKQLSWIVRYPEDYTDDYANIDGETFSFVLQKRIEEHQPTLVTRFGQDVIMCAMASRNRPTFHNSLLYITGRRDVIGMPRWVFYSLPTLSGFFSESDAKIEQDLYRYGDLINSIIPEIDILATVLRQERFYAQYFDRIDRCFLPLVEPYRAKSPWTKALEGKRVLVIHPFEATIRQQFLTNRSKIFSNPDVLPNFELKTIRAVQSIAGNRPSMHKDWFAALEYMEKQIDEIGDFDVAIIGCGAYGMPLGAYVKRLGKVAVHMGGGVQFLFGIKNKRADEDEDATVRNLYNDAWIRPLPEDTPKGKEKVEGGCYW